MTTELTNAAQAALNACERIVGQEGSVQFGIDFHALGSSLRRALAHRPAAQDDSDEAQVADYQEALASVDALVRRLDVALNGDAAASQARLCDIVSQVERQGLRPAAQEVLAALEGLLEAAEWLCGGQDEDTLTDDVCRALKKARGTLAKAAAQQATPELVPLTSDILIQDRTIYVLNKSGENKWWATVFPGFHDNGARVSDDACRAVAADLAKHAATPEPVVLGPLAQRNIFDAIRGAYDLGYNDARNAFAVPGDSAPGYKGRDAEADHGGALLNTLARRLRNAATPEPVGEPVHVEVVGEIVSTDDGNDVSWSIEGGVAAIPAGSVLLIADSPITDDCGSGDVYTRPAAAPAVPDAMTPPKEDGTEYDYSSGSAAGYAEGWNACREAMLAAAQAKGAQA